MAALVECAPHLKGGINTHRLAKLGGWIAAGLVGLVAVGYLILSIAPQKLALVLPDEWRDRIGRQIEESMVDGAQRCEGTDGRTALSALVGRIAEGVAGMPPVSVQVYDIPVLNAFAMPGGRIAVMRKLIDKARNADEVAGVLAHEIGHVAHRHAEAQLIRVTGLQVLVSLATGGSGGHTLGSAASVATLLQYSRNAEREADQYALDALTHSKIDPLAFRNFFETVKKEEGEPISGVFGKIGSMMSTHPITQERIDMIKPLPDGVQPKPSLSSEQWQALRNICGSRAKPQDQL